MVSSEKLKKLQERMSKPENDALKKKIDLGITDTNDGFIIEKYLMYVFQNEEKIKQNAKSGALNENISEIDAIDSNTSALINAIHRHMDSEGWAK